MLDLNGVVIAAGELAPLPSSATRLAALTASDDVALDEIVDVIALDQALTAALLRLVNSAAIGKSRTVTSVRDATYVVGAGAILELAVGRHVRGSMQRALPAFDLEEGELWRHSVAAALTTELASRVLRVRTPPEAFTVALLHDVGKLVLMRFLDSDRLSFLRRAEEEGGLSALDAEAEMLGVHHGELAELIAQNWGLPEAISRPLRAHHAPTAEDGVVADLTHLADVVAKRVGAGKSFDPGLPAVRADAAERLGLDEDSLARLTETVGERLEGVLRKYEA
jgi:HD-like signal output (HDOD) protein